MQSRLSPSKSPIQEFLVLYAMTVLTTIENIKRRIICPPWKIEQETIGKYSGWSAKLELWQYEVCLLAA